MRNVLLAIGLLVSGCATSDYEKPLTDKQRSDFLATLSATDREAFETLVWAREVDRRPIAAEFDTCIDREVSQSDARLAAATVAVSVADKCFPIVERLARGIAMRVPALATGPTGDSLNSWADYQAAEQKAELVSLLVKRVERARASAPSVP